MPKNRFDIPWKAMTEMKPGKAKAVQLLVQGLLTDGSFHKQWFLEEALKALGEDPEVVRQQLNELDYDWEQGRAP